MEIPAAKRGLLPYFLLVLLVFTLLAAGCYLLRPGPAQLKVALYPYVPRIEQFKRAINKDWRAVHPDVKLVFIDDWDGGYADDPPPAADVFVFDAMFLEYFRSRGWLEPLRADEIAQRSDFVDYAIKGVQANGVFYAIPQLGCANILFYHRDDTALALARTLGEVRSALHQCSYTGWIPTDRRGLMLDMNGGTTNASLYLDITHGLNGAYPFPLPSSESRLNPASIKDMRLLLALASFENATREPPADYGRATWFSNGRGRALIGFTEHMSAMSEAIRNNIAFRPLPIADNGQPPLFYADVIGVNPRTRQRGTRRLAVQLANLMASSRTMAASIGPDGPANPYPQYLMATRPSIFTRLGRRFPLYKRMYAMLTGSKPIMFKLNKQSRTWLAHMKDVIRSTARRDYTCGCNQDSVSFIRDGSTAASICSATCAGHGGWNGRWTSQAPARKSVCTCRSCQM